MTVRRHTLVMAIILKQDHHRLRKSFIRATQMKGSIHKSLSNEQELSTVE